MRYPPQFLDRLRQHFRLSEVIGRRIDLRRHGREFMALCPFHQEKTPSFTVSDEKGFYHCFGCGAHGDVIGFLKDHEGLTYPQAVEQLAREAGIALPQVTPEAQRRISEEEALYQVMEKAAAWFTQQLHRPASASAGAREYLEKRGLSSATLSEFRLGYAPPERHALKTVLLRAGVTEAQLKAAGLLSQPEDGQAYDKFRDRIIFPIRDISGRVIAFGGRLLTPHERAPKYLNSPETPLFSKSRVLYNADQARRAAAKTGALVIAEGYMDVIALAQAGIGHAVAPLGTALTAEQLALAWQMADEPVLCLDGDAAGLQAMRRAVHLAMPGLKPGKTLRFCLLPENEDPDSLIRRAGAAEMRRRLEQAVPLAEMLWNMHYGGLSLTTPEKKAAAQEALFLEIGRITHQGLQRAYLDDMRARLRESERAAFIGGKARKGKPESETLRGKHLERRLAAPGNLKQQEAALTLQMVTLTLHYPALLERETVEETLARLSCADNALETLRQELLLLAAQCEVLPGRKEIALALGDARASALAQKLIAQAARDPFHGCLCDSSEEEGMQDALLVFMQAAQQWEQLAIRREVLAEGSRDLTAEDAGSSERAVRLHGEIMEGAARYYHYGKEQA